MIDTIEEPLISTIEAKKSLFDNNYIAKSKKSTQKSKIHYNNRTLQIPYIDKDKLSLKIQEVSDISDCQDIEINYTNKNIAITFNKKKPFIDNAQLKIEFPKDE